MSKLELHTVFTTDTELTAVSCVEARSRLSLQPYKLAVHMKNTLRINPTHSCPTQIADETFNLTQPLKGVHRKSVKVSDFKKVLPFTSRSSTSILDSFLLFSIRKMFESVGVCFLFFA